MKWSNVKKLSKTFFIDWKEFSLSVAVGRFARDCPLFPWEKRRTFYEKQVCAYLERKYGHIIENAADEPERPIAEPVIWVMWWQGENAMPPLVRACYLRLKKVAEKKIILITKDNVHDYIDIPQFIFDKYNHGFLMTAHLSDIIRVLLLWKYGGLWIDATVYIDRIPNEVFLKDFFTLYAPELFPNYISRGKWATFFMYANTVNQKMFRVLYDLFLAYWEEHSKIIDYLLFDYFINIISLHYKSVEKSIASLPINKEYYNLNLNINAAYDYITARNMLKKSSLQKLTYKKVFQLTTENGAETNYARILSARFGSE